MLEANVRLMRRRKEEKQLQTAVKMQKEQQQQLMSLINQTVRKQNAVRFTKSKENFNQRSAWGANE